MKTSWQIERDESGPTPGSYWRFRHQLHWARHAKLETAKAALAASGNETDEAFAGDGNPRDDIIHKLQLADRRQETPTSQQLVKVMAAWFPTPSCPAGAVTTLAAAIPALVMLRCVGATSPVLQRLAEEMDTTSFNAVGTRIVNEIMHQYAQGTQGATNAYFPAVAAHRKINKAWVAEHGATEDDVAKTRATLRQDLFQLMTGTGKWLRTCQEKGWKPMRAAALNKQWPDGRTPALKVAETLCANRSLAEAQADIQSVPGFQKFASKELICDVLLCFPWLPVPADKKTWDGLAKGSTPMLRQLRDLRGNSDMEKLQELRRHSDAIQSEDAHDTAFGLCEYRMYRNGYVSPHVARWRGAVVSWKTNGRNAALLKAGLLDEQETRTAVAQIPQVAVGNLPEAFVSEGGSKPRGVKRTVIKTKAVKHETAQLTHKLARDFLELLPRAKGATGKGVAARSLVNLFRPPNAESTGRDTCEAIKALLATFPKREHKDLIDDSAGGTGRGKLLLSTVAAAALLCSLPNKGPIKQIRARSYQLLAGAKESVHFQTGAAGIAPWLVSLTKDLNIQVYTGGLQKRTCLYMRRCTYTYCFVVFVVVVVVTER